MQTLTKILVTVALALTLSTSAGAVVSIGLVQVGGTYDGILANPGDTLVLDITYGLQFGVGVVLIDAGIVFDGSVSTFDAAGSTETGVAYWNGGELPVGPVATGDIGLVTPYLADGWEKAATGGVGLTYEWFGPPCVFGACTSMGTAAFVLSGQSGVIAIGGVGLPGGTVVGDGTFVNIAGNPALVSLGAFTIIPEPTTASLLGLGLLGLAAAGRRRKR